MKHILVVDDDRFNLVVAHDALVKHYKVSTVNSGREALEFLEKKEVDLILLDIEMPEMNGIETLERINSNPQLASIPVIFLTGISDNDVEAKCIELGAQDYIIKPFYEPAMLVRIRRVLELMALRKHLEQLVTEKTKEVECLTIQTITSFANSIDAKDSYTKYHSQHVAKYAERMARKLGWEKQEIRNLYYSALLHDIGKIGVPDFVLKKPSRLTEEEFDIIKKHPGVGGEILSEVTVVPYLSVGASTHHERYDGSGYPRGLKGKEIPLVGRIVGIVDAVDAILSTRAYRDGNDIAYAISELQRCSGTQFDPELVPLMVEILEEGIDFLDEEVTVDEEGSLISAVLNEYSKAIQIDSLTGLWNKNYIQAKVNECLYIPEKRGALLLIDIDSFRRISNYSGQETADALLVIIAQGIKSELGSKDLAGRVDNDKFVVYLSDVHDTDTVEFKIIQILKNAQRHIADMQLPVRVQVTIGAAFPNESERDFMTLYHQADKALYYTKKDGRKDYFIYTESQEDNVALQMGESNVDVWYLKMIMSERAAAKGIYRVEVNEFDKIFKLLQRKSRRSGDAISMVLFTLTPVTNVISETLDLDEATKCLMYAMDSVLRAGDIVTKYSNSQQIVLFTGVKLEMVDSIAKRVTALFAEMNSNSNIELRYEYEKII